MGLPRLRRRNRSRGGERTAGKLRRRGSIPQQTSCDEASIARHSLLLGEGERARENSGLEGTSRNYLKCLDRLFPDGIFVTVFLAASNYVDCRVDYEGRPGRQRNAWRVLQQ